MKIQRLAPTDSGMLMCIVGNLGFAFDGRELHVHLLIDGTKPHALSYDDYRAKKNRWNVDQRKQPAVRKRHNAWRRAYEQKLRDARKEATA